jgi:hypothetical protein
MSISMRKMIPWFFGLALAALMVTSHSTAQTKPSAPLFTDLGNHRHPMSTKSPQAQQYFNQGLILAYGFNHGEAVRSFKEAIRLCFTMRAECHTRRNLISLPRKQS